MSTKFSTIKIEHDVCKMLRINSSTYRHLLFNSGIAFIERKCGSWSNVATEISKNITFWTWWRVQFAIIDTRIIARNIDDKRVWINSHWAYDFEIPEPILDNVRIESEYKSKQLQYENDTWKR